MKNSIEPNGTEQQADEDYRVGYGRPPKNTQFKKGRSGNPKGRPGRGKSMNDLIEAALNEKLAVTVNGKVVEMTYKEAGAKSIARNIAKGDIRALEKVQAFREKAFDPWEASRNGEPVVFTLDMGLPLKEADS